MAFQSVLHPTVWSGPLVMNKHKKCVIISFVLTSICSDEQNIKLRDYLFWVTSNCLRCVTRQLWWSKILSCVIIFSRYIKLFEVCHPPVVMIKILSCVIISFRLHQTVWGVSPASCDELNLKLHDYFFRVTSNCLRCVTRHLWWTKS